MPIFDYKCNVCGHTFDSYFPSREKVTQQIPCENCKNPADKIISSSVGIIFNGAGFSVTDKRAEYTRQNATLAGIEEQIQRDEKHGRIHQNNVHQWRGVDIKKEKVTSKEVI